MCFWRLLMMHCHLLTCHRQRDTSGTAHSVGNVLEWPVLHCTPVYLVLGASPWGTSGLRQGMAMMQMLRYRPWSVFQDSSPSATMDKIKRKENTNKKSGSFLILCQQLLQIFTTLTCLCVLDLLLVYPGDKCLFAWESVTHTDRKKGLHLL